jgi:hypothetical protein
MAAKTLRAHVRWVAPDIPDPDLGERLITISDLIEDGRVVGSYAAFEHNGQSVSGSVVAISPPDWEKSGVTPVVKVNRSLGS